MLERLPWAVLLAVGLALAPPLAAQETPPPAEPAPDPYAEEEPVFERGIVHDHAVRIALGLGAPFHIWGLEEDFRESVFRLGSTSGADGSVSASAGVEYRRNLLAVRLSILSKSLALGSGTHVDVFDGVESQELALTGAGGYFGLAALVGVQWEPTLYESANRGEGLSLALSALVGHEHISLWGEFGEERVPNFRGGARSFHWIVERQRLDAEAVLRWRHVVSAGDTVRHLLGMEAGLAASFFAHIPYLSTASEPIEGATSAWGSWMVFVRIIWEMGLDDV